MAQSDAHGITIQADSTTLEATLEVPPGASGMVVFAHGSGSSRFSPRNGHVAAVLRAGGLATLLLDLLTPAEEQVDLRTRHIRFDIERLTDRLVGTIDWLGSQDPLSDLPIGLFGASTGAAAALAAASERPAEVRAVVSRGGRPDLANGALAAVRAPTLLIVGGRDEQVIELNQVARRRMEAGQAPEVELIIVPGATHLFEEPGTLDEVAMLARDWFVQHLAPLAGAQAPTPHR